MHAVVYWSCGADTKRIIDALCDHEGSEKVVVNGWGQCTREWRGVAFPVMLPSPPLRTLDTATFQELSNFYDTQSTQHNTHTCTKFEVCVDGRVYKRENIARARLLAPLVVLEEKCAAP